MTTQRATAAQRREQAIAAGMRAFADRGLTMSSMQQVAQEVGVSQPYVFRLFGSKHAFFLACIDELENRVCDAFRQAVAVCTADPFEAMGAGFRALVADGVITGLWLQACAAARGDEAVAARCRSLISTVLCDVERATGAEPEDLAQFLANGSLVVVLQAIGVDLAGGSRAAVESLRIERAVS